MNKRIEYSEYLVQEMLRNVLSWDHTIERAIIIIESNEMLMNKYKQLSEKNVSEMEICRMHQLIRKMTELINFIESEKKYALKNLKRTNKQERMFSGYSLSYNDSTFIDKDF